jgi:predicted XRE-type DNA-binding protein
MDPEKRRRLSAKGWTLGDAEQFLGLSDAESRLIEIKLAFSSALLHLRQELGCTQTRLATLLGSSQSRVAKMEGGDRSVSIDLLVRGLLALGATRSDLARVLRRAKPSPNTASAGTRKR